MSAIWTPPGHQFRGVREARKAAQDYDPNLDFGWNEVTNQWCIYIKAGTMEIAKNNDHPILGFQNIPSRDTIHKRLYASDAFKRGIEVLRDWHRHNDEIEAQNDARHADVDGQVAEAFEWGMRKMEHPRAPIKIYMPGE